MLSAIGSEIGANDHTTVVDAYRTGVDCAGIAQMNGVAIAVAFEAMVMSTAVGIRAYNTVVLVNACRTRAIRSHDWS